MDSEKSKKVVLKRKRGEVEAEIRKGQRGQLILKTDNILLVPLAIVETLLIGMLMALNYCFRFDTTVRYNADMSNLSSVLITCDPERLRYELARPYFDYTYTDKSLTGLELNYDLPEWVFFLCALLIPLFIFCFVEGLKGLYPRGKQKEVQVFGNVIPQSARRILRITCGYLAGGCITGIFICIIKFNIVSPRPHFMSVCFSTASNTTPSACSKGLLYWNPLEDCEKPIVEETLLEALKSFPSYHAAVAVFCGVYTATYVTLSTRIESVYSGPLLLMLALMSMTAFGATHRLSTGHSFPRDIFIGILIGCIVAYYVIKVSMNSFGERKWKAKLFHRSSPTEGNLMPVAELKSSPTSSHPKEEEKITNFRDRDSDTGLDSDDSSENFGEVVISAEAFHRIPRAFTTSEKPAQAVNANIGVARGISDTSFAPTNAGVTAAVTEQQMRHIGHPSQTTEAPKQKPRHHSHSHRHDTKLRAADTPVDVYNVPRQRLSAPMMKQQELLKGAYGRSYDGRMNPREPPPLSPYKYPHGYANQAMDITSEL